MEQNNKSKESQSWFGVIGPLVFLILYAGAVFYIRGKLPEPDELIAAIKTLYQTYGYYLIFFSAIAEATFLLSLYVPGTTVILIGAAIASTGALSFPLVLILGTLGFLIGYSANYILGKYGWYHILVKFGLEKAVTTAKEKLHRHGGKALLVGYLHPTSATFLSTASGVIKMPFRKFLLYSLIAQVLWSTLWGTIAYSIGYVFVELFIKYYGIGVFIVIVLWFLRKRLSRKGKA